MRNRNGFSIVLVTSLGLILVSTALAVTATLLPIYQSVGARNIANQRQAAAEIGIQYALAKLNSVEDISTISALTILPTFLGGPSVSITVEPVDASAMSGSPVYDKAANNFAVNNKRTPDFRKITSTATYGLSKSVITTYVAANLTQAVTASNSNTSGVTPFFNNALFGAESLTLTGSRFPSRILELKSESGSGQAQIGSNQNITFTGNTTIDGNVVANNNKSTTSIVGSSATKIGGNLTFNGSMENNGNVSAGSPPDAFIADTPENNSDLSIPTNRINVLGDGQLHQASGQINQQVTQTDFAPSNLTKAGASATYSSNTPTAITVVPPSQGQVVNLGAVNLTAGTTMTLPPGNYTASSLNVSRGAQLNIDMTNTANANGVNISVQGDSSSSTPISISGKVSQIGIPVAKANNFQLFYNGTQSVSVRLNDSGSAFNGLIYAPNASVSVLMRGQEFHGAVAGNSVQLAGFGKFFYDPTTVQPGVSSSTKANTSNSLYYIKNSPTQNHGFHVLSWSELSNSP